MYNLVKLSEILDNYKDFLEESHSGLVRHGANVLTSKGVRGFKSHLLRQMGDVLKIEKNQSEEISEIREIVWQIPEYEYMPKNSSWHWLSLMIVIILLAFAFWQKNFLFAVFIIISFLAVNYLANRFPTIWQIKINNKGISIGLPNKPESDKFYPLGDIESFDIHSDVGGDLYGELILNLRVKITLIRESFVLVKRFLLLDGK